MAEIPLFKRLYYVHLGNLYWFSHYTSIHRLLGIRYSTLIKLLALLLMLAAWIFRWNEIARYASLLLTVWIFIAYWRAKRANYFRFVPATTDLPIPSDLDRIAPYRRIPLLATGVFSLQDWERSVLLRPAEYWQVPRGDHALMVEHRPRKYLYQFFGAQTLQNLQRGWLLYGWRPKPALAITFISIWGPEFSEIQFSIFGAEKKAKKPKIRTIYISFTSEEAEQAIYQNILNDFNPRPKESL